MKKISADITCLLVFAALAIGQQALATSGTVLINEIAWMGTSVSANDEWLELTNITAATIDVTGWQLKAIDGSPIISLTGSIPANSFFLLERTDDETVLGVVADQLFTGTFSNTGEHLQLFDANGNLVDEINATAGWPGGDNTSKQTLARVNLTTWQSSTQPGGTPKANNALSSNQGDETNNNENDDPGDTPPADDQEEDDIPADDTTKTPSPDSVIPVTKNTTSTHLMTAKKGEVRITELFPNPFGVDSDEEFVELYNASKRVIKIAGWHLHNQGKQRIELPPFRMYPDSTVVLYRPQTGLRINNDRERLTLTDSAGTIIDTILFTIHAPEGLSYQRVEDTWQWLKPTSGTQTIVNVVSSRTDIQAVIQAPDTASKNQQITLDGSDSFGPRDRNIHYFWQFDDGATSEGMVVKHTFETTGKHQVLLTVSATSEIVATAEYTITITDPLATKNQSDATETPAATTLLVATPPTVSEKYVARIMLSEIIANPDGADEQNEFIELFNTEDFDVDLGNWQVDDADGGSKPYTLPAGTLLHAHEYKAFFRPQTKLTLNNDSETVRLFGPDGSLVDSADLDGIKEGISAVRDEEMNWQPSSTPTPDQLNTLDAPSVAMLSPTSTLATAQKDTAGVADPTTSAEPASKNKYLISSLSALVVMGLGVGLKIKKMMG
jgi:hypothetical protein